MTRANWIMLGIAVPILLGLGYIDAVEAGEAGASLIPAAIGYALAPVLVATLIFGWKRGWRRRIPPTILVLAGILGFGKVSATLPRFDNLTQSNMPTPKGHLGIRLYNTLARNDSLAQSAGEVAEFVLNDGTKYVSSEHRTLDGIYRVASLYEGSGPSFAVVYTRWDGQPLSASDVTRLLEHEGSNWTRTDSLTWWDNSHETSNGEGRRIAQCTTDRNTCTFSIPEIMGTFMARSPELRQTIAR